MKKAILVLIILSLCQILLAQSPREQRISSLEEVETWFYYLAFNIPEKDYKAILHSSYEMIVLEPVFTEINNLDFPIAKFVNNLHDSKKDRLVIAYIDIGQAEEWRSYWQNDWALGNPEWIVASDPDGWEGNFPVAYWHKEWQDIFLAKDGYLQKLIDAGFDGVYLDWIEAYSDETVIAKAELDGVNALEEMVNWVGNLGRYARAQSPEFLIIAQNAAELIANKDYVKIIDAIAQEQTWFDGSSDNNPAGDCPLPTTDEDVNSVKYLFSLSSECKRVYLTYPDSTLHMSSSSILVYLEQARAQGLPIFTVDYALNEDNINEVYAKSHKLDFKPFVSNRFLNIFIEPKN